MHAIKRNRKQPTVFNINAYSRQLVAATKRVYNGHGVYGVYNEHLPPCITARDAEKK